MRITSIIFLALAATSLAAEPTPAKPAPEAACPACREEAKPEPAKKEGACCKEESASAAFSRESVYQADATFTDDSGQGFTLAQLRGRPVVLTMFFSSCGYACPLLVTDMQALREMLPQAVREQAAFVLVSFDVERDTPTVLAKYRAQRQLDAHWKLLHGDDASVREIAALLGVKYKQEADRMFAHSNLITILNTEGEIVHQRAGLQGGIEEAVKALATASNRQ